MAAAQFPQRPVRLRQGELPHLRPQPHRRCQRQELPHVGAGHVRHRADLLLEPEIAGVVEVQQGPLVALLLADGIDHQPTARFEMAQGGHIRPPGGRGVDHRPQRLRRGLVDAAGPVGSEAAGKGPLPFAAGEHGHPGAGEAMAHHLQHQVAGGAEAAEPQRLAVLQAREPQRAVADRPGAQQRGHRGVVEGVRQAVGEGRRNPGEGGIAAVHVTAGGHEVGTEILPPGAAVAAAAAGGVDPGDAHPCAPPQVLDALARLLHPPHDLMAGDDRQAGRRRAPLDLVELGVAHAAHRHPHQHLPRPRHRPGHLGRLQRLGVLREIADAPQQHRLHGRLRLRVLPETYPRLSPPVRRPAGVGTALCGSRDRAAHSRRGG